MEKVEDLIVHFFEKNKMEMIKNWYKNIHISEEDIYNERNLINGEMMYEMVIQCFQSPINDVQIQSIAQQIASERVNADVNISQFVHNVNLGRSQCIKYLYETGLSIDELKEPINRVNDCFNKFLYYSVSQYTELKNKIIEDKNKFISESHKDRLTILGQMSSSFVHECRNPLTSVIGFIHLLQSEYPSLKYMDIINRELRQLEFRISQFLLLSKKEVIGKEKSEFYIDHLLNDVIEFLYPSIVDANINVSTSLQEIKYLGLTDEIRQVFMNIIFNSIDALANKDGVRNVYISAEQNKDNIMVRISNDGPVIPEASLKTIFEPFVTTKKLGTGLGLFVCQEIIQKHGGQISCESNESLTTFTIQFSAYESS